MMVLRHSDVLKTGFLLVRVIVTDRYSHDSSVIHKFAGLRRLKSDPARFRLQVVTVG